MPPLTHLLTPAADLRHCVVACGAADVAYGTWIAAQVTCPACTGARLACTCGPATPVCPACRAWNAAHRGRPTHRLPCTLLSHGGLWEWVLVDVCQARRWVTDGPYINHISHPFLREACERLLQVPLAAPSRGLIPAMDYHDDALVFSVAGSEAPWMLWRGDSAQVQAALAREECTMGLLRRLA